MCRLSSQFILCYPCMQTGTERFPPPTLLVWRSKDANISSSNTTFQIQLLPFQRKSLNTPWALGL